MTPTAHYILQTIATAPGPMTVEGLMHRLEAGVANRLLRVQLNELLQDRRISTTEDPATRRPLITGLTPSGSGSLGISPRAPASASANTTRRRVRNAKPKRPALLSEAAGAEICNRIHRHLNSQAATEHQLAAALDLTLEETGGAIRVLQRRGHIQMCVDETRPSIGTRRNRYTTLWISQALAAQRRQDIAAAERHADTAHDEAADRIAALIVDKPRLHAVFTERSTHR